MDLITACKVARDINSRRDSEGWTVSSIELAGYPEYHVRAANDLIETHSFTFKTADEWQEVRKTLRKANKERQ